MLIRKISIKNKFVNYENISMDFSKIGIYKILGENGTGKTSVINKIIFGNYDVEFENDQMLDIWNKKRGSIFSYVPQNITYCNLYVFECISMGNRKVKKEEVFKYLQIFNLDESILKKKFETLSGGEKKKIQIISGILKDTKYLFLDEPSNNLDDAATDSLKKIVLDYSKKHTVILISHDERLEVDAFKYTINGRDIRTEPSASGILKENECFDIPKTLDNKFIIRKTAKLFYNLPNFLTLLLFFVVLLFMAIYSTIEIQSDFNFESFPRENIILAQSTTSYDDLMDNYINGERIKVTDEAKAKYIDLNDVVTISNLQGISKIYLTDFKYQSQIQNKLINNELDDSLNYVSCPKEYYNDFWENCILDYGLNYNEGIFPSDYAYEVSISKNLLIKYFGYNSSTVNSAIGDNIVLNVNSVEREYKIVGFSYFDIVQISFQDENNFGVYCVNENTYEDYGNAQIEYDASIDSWVGMVREMVIVTEAGYEDNVLNYMIENYASANYYSHHFSLVWAKDYNNNRIIQILIPNLIVASIMSIGIVFINMKSVKLNYYQLQVYGNYYINRRRLKLLYVLFSSLEYIFVALIVYFSNFLFSQFGYISNYYILFNSIILIVPLVLIHIFFLTKADNLL